MAEPVKCAPGLTLVIAHTGVSAPTSEVNTRVRNGSRNNLSSPEVFSSDRHLIARPGLRCNVEIGRNWAG